MLSRYHCNISLKSYPQFKEAICTISTFVSLNYLEADSSSGKINISYLLSYGFSLQVCLAVMAIFAGQAYGGHQYSICGQVRSLGDEVHSLSRLKTYKEVDNALDLFFETYGKLLTIVCNTATVNPVHGHFSSNSPGHVDHSSFSHAGQVFHSFQSDNYRG